MLVNSRHYALWANDPGHERVDLEGVVTGLQRISQLATDFPDIEELEITPLIVGAIGTDPFVADARITLRATAPGAADSHTGGLR